jgi:hypothetical protein
MGAWALEGGEAVSRNDIRGATKRAMGGEQTLRVIPRFVMWLLDIVKSWIRVRMISRCLDK